MATGAMRRAKLESYRSPPTNQQPARYRPDALPVAQPTVTETLKEKLLFCSKSGPNVPVTQQVHDGTEMYVVKRFM